MQLVTLRRCDVKTILIFGIVIMIATMAWYFSRQTSYNPLVVSMNEFIPDKEFIGRDFCDIASLTDSYTGIYGNLDTNEYVFKFVVSSPEHFISQIQEKAKKRGWTPRDIITEQNHLVFIGGNTCSMYQGQMIIFDRVPSSCIFFCAVCAETNNLGESRAWQILQHAKENVR